MLDLNPAPMTVVSTINADPDAFAKVADLRLLRGEFQDLLGTVKDLASGIKARQTEAKNMDVVLQSLVTKVGSKDALDSLTASTSGMCISLVNPKLRL